MSFLARFHAFVQEQSLFKVSERILLAVSGGRDSVVLVHLFKQSGFDFGIAHCNFKLRGTESDEDELFVAQLATRMEVPLFVTHLDAQMQARAEGISIQMAARNLRYQWLEKTRKEFNFDHIAFAHHQNDAVETILLNLTRGTGIAGLHGILPKRNHFIRPMLCFDRDEIDQIVAELGILYREDSSNQSTKYARNKIRLEVIPKLKELNPSLEQTFEANRKRFVELEILLNDHVAALRGALFNEIALDEYRIALSALKKLRPLYTLLFGLFSPFGFTEAVLLNLSKSWDGISGKNFESVTHRLLLDRGHLLLSRKETKLPPQIEVNLFDKQVSWGNLYFNIQHVAIADFELKKGGVLAQFDLELLIFPLKIRTWQVGDFFYPLGMRGKKKLSDFFIGQKIPRSYKNQIPILENGNGDILCVVGYRQDERYKVHAQTQKILLFTHK